MNKLIIRLLIAILPLVASMIVDYLEKLENNKKRGLNNKTEQLENN